MTITVDAVFTGGVLRPLQPLALAEGQTVQITVAPARPIGPRPLRAPTPEEEAYIHRLNAAQSLEEMFAVMQTAPPDSLPEGYDLCRALNANRKATGEQLLYPELEDDSAP